MRKTSRVRQGSNWKRAVFGQQKSRPRVIQAGLLTSAFHAEVSALTVVAARSFAADSAAAAHRYCCASHSGVLPIQYAVVGSRGAGPGCVRVFPLTLLAVRA